MQIGNHPQGDASQALPESDLTVEAGGRSQFPSSLMWLLTGVSSRRVDRLRGPQSLVSPTRNSLLTEVTKSGRQVYREELTQQA